jgi:hypothetical protein
MSGIKFKGYAPDVDPKIPGILTDCSALVPSLKGMKGAPSPQTRLLPALAAACRGSALLRKLDNSNRLFAGSVTALYEAATTAWTDRTRAVGGAYALGTDNRWRFAQRGDVSFAAAKSDILQSSSAGAFANNAATAPKAAIVEVVNGFIFLFDVNDQGLIFDSADRPHGWWAARTSGTWTPSIANEAYTGDLTSTPGKITGGRKFGQTVIAYKERSMYQGVYVGQSGWEFTQIPGDAGALTHEVVVDIGSEDNPVHLTMGYEDFYRYDGSRPVPIGNPLKETVFGDLNRAFTHACMALHDRRNSRVYFFYPVGSAITPDKCVVYNYKTGLWGRDDRTVQAVVEFVAAGVTYDDLGTLYTTYADLPNLSYDTAFLAAGYPLPGIFNTSNVLQTLDGNTVSSTMTTGDYGSDEFMTLLAGVQPEFLTRPASASMTNFHRDNIGSALTQDQQVSMDARGRFDVLRSARWHRATFTFNGNVEMSGIAAAMQEDGLE